MKHVPKLDAKMLIIPHDGGTNTRNPYDQLTPEERQEKIVQLCARIYLRMRSWSPEEFEPPSVGSEV